MLAPDDLITLVPEKLAAGGRMLGRHHGMIVLAAGAIPGECARVRIERVERSLAFGRVAEIVEPHPARRPVDGDPRCGGSVLAHVDYAEQCRLKGELIRDALARVGKIPLAESVAVTPSPEHGYRMRARLHLRRGQVGFFLEGTHQLCDAGMTKQLLPDAVLAARTCADRLAAAGFDGDADIELSESRAGDERVLHLETLGTGPRQAVPALEAFEGVTGLTCSERGSAYVRSVFGVPYVADVVQGARLRRHARAFFQANRYLLDDLVSAVLEACEPGLVVDLYAGVGLFGACLARGGAHTVIAVEGHGATASDLEANAVPFADAMRVERTSVERFVATRRVGHPFTLVLDPPRTGMTRDAAVGAIGMRPERMVFVSCDVATLARDLRKFLDAGYRLDALRGFDLFPNTAHVEALATLSLV